jgi:hypothetical protein
MMCDETEDVAGMEPYQRWSKPRAKGMRNEAKGNSMPKTYRRMGVIDVRGWSLVRLEREGRPQGSL